MQSRRVDQTKACAYCGKKFWNKKKAQECCSNSCGRKLWHQRNPHVYGDAKQCARCRETKPIDQFAKAGGTRKYKIPYCLGCVRQMSHETYLKRRTLERRLRVRAQSVSITDWLGLTCRYCHEMKDPSSFPPSTLGKMCGDCMREKTQRWRESRPALYAKQSDRSRVKQTFNLTVEEYEGIVGDRYIKQNGKCAVCERTDDVRLVLDHCHETMTMRGLICTRCNRAIGMLRDDPGMLLRAYDYLCSYLPDGGALVRQAWER